MLDGDHLAAVSTLWALRIRIPDEFELIVEYAGIRVAKGGKREEWCYVGAPDLQRLSRHIHLHKRTSYGMV